MWDYTDKVLDLFYNPKHQGVIEDKGEPGIKVAVGEVGSIACGDALRLYLKVEEDTEKILDARFQTFGCTSAIASSEALSELIKGKTLDEALKITNKDIANYLGGLPQAKMHCSVMGQEALQSAIYNYRGIKAEAHHSDDEGTLVCTCFGISESKIRRVIVENNLTTVEEVTNYIKAGGGCGSCLASIEDIIASVQKQAVTSFMPSGALCEKREPRKFATQIFGDPEQAFSDTDKQISLKKLTSVQKIALIQKVLDEEVRPVLIADGGDVDLYDVEGNLVKVVLQGACGSCSSSAATLKIAIESRLRDRVSPDVVVEAV